MDLYFHNTLSKKKEKFVPLKKGEVTMYNCGPTVYNYAHIGNLRAYVFVDVLRRALEYNGYKVKQVMNITDVGHLTSDGDDGDDKMVKALKREGKPFTLLAMREVADFYTEAFKKDLTALNIKIPEILEHASDHIPEDIELIKKLEAKGFAYKTKDGLYFDTGKFPSYGKLGSINLKGQLAGARVAINSEKKNPVDFTLWKISKNDIGWESPWGKGFPGWHIECSAMSSKYLGQPFDIHTGGIDHIPVHHNNEIAQSETAYEVPLAHYWLHNEFVNINEGKMAKSEENFLTLDSLNKQGLSPIAYRYSLLATHYRKPMNFTPEAIPGAQIAFESFITEYSQIKNEGGNISEKHAIKFLEAINNDLNTSVALSIAWGVINDDTVVDADKKATLLKFDEVLGLDIENQSKKLLKKETKFVPAEIEELCLERETARKNKDWKKADEIRRKIEKKGYEIDDIESGFVIRQKS